LLQVRNRNYNFIYQIATSYTGIIKKMPVKYMQATTESSFMYTIEITSTAI